MLWTSDTVEESPTSENQEEFAVRTPVLPFATAAAAALVLAGCSGSADPSTAGDTASPTGATSASPTRSVAPSPSDDSQTDEESQIAANCPVGRWKLDNDSWADLVRSKLSGEGSLDSVEGDVFLNLGADGSYSSVYQDWTMTMSVEGGKSVITRAGTDTGTWADRDGRAVLTDENSGSAVTGYFESPEGRIDLPTTGSTPTSVGESFSYECEGTTLLATTDEGTFSLTWAP